jgi:hypothetical protein
MSILTRPREAVKVRHRVECQEIPRAICARKDLGSSDKLVFGVVFGLVMHGAWQRCFAKNETIAEMTGLSIRQVIRSLGTLETHGLIRRPMNEDRHRIEIEIAWEGMPGCQGGVPSCHTLYDCQVVTPITLNEEAKPGVSPTAQNFNPPSDPEPALAPDLEQLSRTIACARGSGPLARFAREAIRGWVRHGLISAETVPDDLLAHPPAPG